MKKLMLAATALAVAAALAGCGRNDDNAATTASTSTPPSTSAPSSTDSTNLATAPATSDSSANMATAPATSDSSTNMAAAPATSSTTEPSSSTVASSSGMESSSAGSTAAMGASGNGQTVYSSTCAMCHAAGVAGAPKPGDKADWGPRIAQGNNTLYQHALNGFQGKKGTMPPKGGNTSLPDADVKAAVDYMVSQSK